MSRVTVLAMVAAGCFAFTVMCACPQAATNAPVKAPRQRYVTTLMLMVGCDAATVLEDASGARDSVDEGGDSVTRIEGCTRQVGNDQTSLEGTDNDEPPSTLFTFSREPRWPLVLRWFDSGASQMNVGGYTIVAGELDCSGSMEVQATKPGRLRRIVIRPERDQRSKQCELRFTEEFADSVAHSPRK